MAIESRISRANTWISSAIVDVLSWSCLAVNCVVSSKSAACPEAEVLTPLYYINVVRLLTRTTPQMNAIGPNWFFLIAAYSRRLFSIVNSGSGLQITNRALAFFFFYSVKIVSRRTWCFRFKRQSRCIPKYFYWIFLRQYFKIKIYTYIYIELRLTVKIYGKASGFPPAKFV